MPLVALYIVAGVLVLGGLGVVALDLWQAPRRAKEVAQRPVEHFYGGAWISRPGKTLDPNDLERKLLTLKANQEHALKQTRVDLAEVLIGNRGRRVGGLGALVLGLLLGGGANILTALQ